MEQFDFSGVAQRLKTLREERGLSIPQLAAGADVSDNILYRLERLNNRYAPAVATLMSLSDFYNVSTDYILRGGEYGYSLRTGPPSSHTHTFIAPPTHQHTATLPPTSHDLSHLQSLLRRSPK